jgi:hypothetical protein
LPFASILSFIRRIFISSFLSKEIYMFVTISFTRRLQMAVLLFLFPVFGPSSVIFSRTFISCSVASCGVFSFISRIFFTSFFGKKINMLVTVCLTGRLQVSILFSLFVFDGYNFLVQYSFIKSRAKRVKIEI